METISDMEYALDIYKIYQGHLEDINQRLDNNDNGN